MRPEYQLIRMGGRYERASLASPRDYPTMIEIEKHLGSLYEDPAVEYLPSMWFIRGRNLVRRKRGLEGVAA